MSYNRINNITGWVVFAISLFVYGSTAERTASFWDCGEFIAVARHLQTPHPPGAPIFSLLGRIFSLFSGDGFGGWEASTEAAFWVNMMSAVSGAFTALFLFWSVTMLAKKLLNVTNEVSLGDKIAIMGAGLVGALACTFSDSIWFSAVEAEVYAISLFFTAFVVWAMLKWETKADSPDSDRWLILIAYMMGLSIGVHLLNLVTIPALALIFYFKRYKPTLVGTLLALFISAVVLFAILSALPGLSEIAFSFDIFFVNILGMPFNSGAFFFFFLIVAGLAAGLFWSAKAGLRALNVSLLGTSFILVGFLSYALIIIRSGQNPPIDENNPEDLPNFISYLLREQYGDRPLLSGPQYNIDQFQSVLRSKLNQEYPQAGGQEIQRKIRSYNKNKYDMKSDGAVVSTVETYDRYERIKGKYRPYYYDSFNKRAYDNKVKSFLPRMYSSGHIDKYEELLQSYTDKKGFREIRSGEKIPFFVNMHYMLDRQLGHMYWRYFRWNFVGREGQKQHSGSIGPFADSNEELPELLKSMHRNHFYAIPLLLGLIGLVFQLFKDWKNFTMVAVLFFFTGIAIILYLNAPPVEPRERDYAYAGSFYTFTMWIGLAVIGIYQLLTKVIQNKLATASVSLAVCMLAPYVMMAQGWDDHDRSKRFFSVDGAKNILESCAENAIIFTAGDNDTFPLWYVQEVEGFRTDVRVCNLSLLNTDWYIDQMRRKAHDSEALPITFKETQYRQGVNDYLQYVNTGRKEPMLLDKFISAIKNKGESVKISQYEGIFKTARKFTIPLDSASIVKLDYVPEVYKSKIPNEITFDNTAKTLYKADMIMLDMINEISKSGWERPIYFSTTAGGPGSKNFQGIKAFLQLEGLAYRLVPFPAYGQINGDIMHRNLKDKFEYRALADETIAYTDDYDRMVMGLKVQFLALAKHHLKNNDKKKAIEIMDFYHEQISDKNFPWSGQLAPEYLDVTFKVYGKEEGLKLYNKLKKQQADVLQYFSDPDNDDASFKDEYTTSAYYFLRYKLAEVLIKNDAESVSEETEAWFKKNARNRLFKNLEKKFAR